MGGILSGIVSWQIAASWHYEKGETNGVIEATILHSWSYKLNTLVAEQGDFERIETSNRDMMYSTVLMFEEWLHLPGISEENKAGLKAYITDIAEHYSRNPEPFLSEADGIFQSRREGELLRLREILESWMAQSDGRINADPLLSTP